MRTTVAIDGDTLAAVKLIARARRISLGKVMTELIRRGLALGIGERHGFPVFSVPADARRITAADVAAARDDP
jgi:hypothetical protein